MNFVIPQTRDLFKSINGFPQFAYHRLQIILNKVFQLHCIKCFINVSLHPSMQNNYQNDIQCHYSPKKVFLRDQRESFFVINVFLLVKLLATRQTLYISMLPIKSLSTIDIYLQLMGFNFSSNLMISQMSCSTISFITLFMASINLRVRGQHDLTKVNQTFSVNLMSYSCS